MRWIKENWKIAIMTFVFMIGVYMLALTLGVAAANAADKGGPLNKIAGTEIVDSSDRWTSCGVGLVGGKSWTETFIFDSTDMNAGVQVFCDGRLPNSNLVVFAKADYRMAGIQQQGFQDADRQWSAIAGLGFLMSPSTKIYAGVGHTQLDGSVTIPQFDRGLTLAAGIETFILKNVTLGFEYRNIDLGDAGGGILSSNRSEALVSLNYRF